MTPTPIAHRGLWLPKADRQNTFEACHDALSAGLGLEVDVRRNADGDLVLSHDSPCFYAATKLAELLAVFSNHCAVGHSVPLLVDLKEPGTEAETAAMLAEWRLLPHAWLFDFELAGCDPLLSKTEASGVRCLARVSDREPAEALPAWASGWWADQWEQDWVNADWLARVTAPVFVCAPDLHARPFDLGLLREWRGAAGVCTDWPHLVADVLSGRPELAPAEPWW